MNYFKDCITLNEVKQRYRELAKQYHPDTSGSDTTAIMQQINTQYKQAINAAARGKTRDNINLSEEEIEAEILNAEGYREAINAIINLDGIFIEVCGGWIWVTGNTFPHRKIFREFEFQFASKKKAWYFRSVEYETQNHRPLTMDEIRMKYGSEKINTKPGFKQIN